MYGAAEELGPVAANAEPLSANAIAAASGVLILLIMDLTPEGIRDFLVSNPASPTRAAAIDSRLLEGRQECGRRTFQSAESCVKVV
jgi:hypothetical protein